MNINKNKKGFTLVELMAVVAIIAILAAVLVPTVTGYINRSKKTAIIAQARNVVSAVDIWNSTVDHGDNYIGDWHYVVEAVKILEKNQPDIDVGDISRIKNMSYVEARFIINDPKAMQRLQLDEDGNFLVDSYYDYIP